MSEPPETPTPSASIARRVGALVRERRKAQKLSQEELAGLAGLSKNYVGSIERGEYDVTISTLHRVTAVLRCRVADLLDVAGI